MVRSYRAEPRPEARPPMGPSSRPDSTQAMLARVKEVSPVGRGMRQLATSSTEENSPSVRTVMVLSLPSAKTTLARASSTPSLPVELVTYR